MIPEEKIVIGSLLNDPSILDKIELPIDSFSAEGKRIIEALSQFRSEIRQSQIDFGFIAERSQIPLIKLSELIDPKFIVPFGPGFENVLKKIKESRIVTECLSSLNFLLKEYEKTRVVPKEEVIDLANKILDSLDSKDIKIINLKDVEEEPVTWLWPNYIPRKKITIIGGLPGTGKTRFITDLICRMVSNQLSPDKQLLNGERALILNGEYEIGDVIKKMAVLSNANEDKIFCLQENGLFFLDDEDGLKRLHRIIKNFKPDVLIIDPIISFLSTLKNNDPVVVVSVPFISGLF